MSGPAVASIHRAKRRRFFVASAVALGALGAPARAHAQTPAVAGPCDSAEHAEGRRLRDAGRDEEALALFGSIYQRDRSACARARMGLALRALGRWSEAEAAITEALAQAGDPWVLRSRGAMESERAQIREHLGELEVRLSAAVPGAELWLNGQRAGALPMSAPLWVAGGSAVLEVRAAGYEAVRRTAEITVGQRNRETVALVPVAPVALAPPAQPRREATPPIALPSPATTPTRLDGTMRSMGVAFIVGGGLATIVGSAFWIAADGRYRHYTDDPECRSTTQGPELLCGDSRSAANQFRRGGVAALGVGAAFVTGGVILLVTGRPARPGGRERATLSCAPETAGFTGVRCAGVF